MSNLPNPGQGDSDFDGIGDVCDDTPIPVEICNNRRDDDGDGLIDFEDPDCLPPPGEEFRFILSNCQIESGNLGCDAEQISPLPPTYDAIGCKLEQDGTGIGRCGLVRIDGGGSDGGICFTQAEPVVCFVETDD